MIGISSRSQSLYESVHRLVFALKERFNAISLNDYQYGVQCFLVGVEGLIPYGRGVLFVDDFQNPARVVLALLDVDLNLDAVHGDLPAERQHDDFRIGHGFSHANTMLSANCLVDGTSAAKVRAVVGGGTQVTR